MSNINKTKFQRSSYIYDKVSTEISNFKNKINPIWSSFPYLNNYQQNINTEIYNSSTQNINNQVVLHFYNLYFTDFKSKFNKSNSRYLYTSN